MTEIERRAAVESAWAIREVYADSLNVTRMADWQDRRALMCLEPSPPRFHPNPKPEPKAQLWFRRALRVAA